MYMDNDIDIVAYLSDYSPVESSNYSSYINRRSCLSQTFES